MTPGAPTAPAAPFPGAPPAEDLLVDLPEAVEVLLDPRRRAALLPFALGPVSLGEAARAAGESANTTLHRARRWLDLGLLVPAGTVRRGGRAVRLYRAAAPSFFLPFRLTTAETLHALARAVHLPDLDEVLGAYVRTGARLADDWGVRLEVRGRRWSVEPSRDPRYRCSPLDPENPPVLLERDTLRLAPDDAKSLQADLAAVLDRYRARERADGAPLHLFVGLTPAG